jgi:CBS-domain-containing membrane protein
MQHVSEWMKKDVACVRPWDDLSKVAQLCWERDIGWVPVLDGEDRLVGVVTDRDALLTMHFRGCGPAESRVEHAMSRELKSVMPQTTLPAALEVMARNGLRRLPVIDAEQKLVGVFTMADAARATPKAGTDDELVEVVREVLKPRAGEEAAMLQPKARVAPSKGDYAKHESRMRTLSP